MSEEKQVRCIVSGPNTGPLGHVPVVEVNGRKAALSLNTVICLAQWAVDALKNSDGYDVTILGDEEPVSPPVPSSGDGGGAAASPGGTNGGTDTFDPEAIIIGDLDEVKAKLTGLTVEQLEKVAAAEIDREQPRKGVAVMIEKAKATLAGGE